MDGTSWGRHSCLPETDGRQECLPHVSLVIPAYNEADGIVQAVDEADAALASLGSMYEIIVVDDGSRDATAERVRGAARRLPALRLVQHPVKRGYGAALRTGFDAARGARIAFTDADCQFHLEDLGPLLRLTDGVPIAVGYRVDRQDSRLRKLYSRGYNLLARTLLGTKVRDIDCALKVFRRDALGQILPQSNGFLVNTEMLTRARQRRLRIAEAGVRHRPRLRGTSKVSIFDIPRTLNALVPFWWSQVLFPRVAPADGSPRTALVLPALIVGLMAALMFFSRLGAPLLEPEEARYAEISRQMLAEGRIVTPVWHGEAYYHKPPLLYWLVMASYSVFGVHDWAARLVPACAGILTVLATYFWAVRAVGRWPAFVSAAMLCLFARNVYQAGMLTFDGLLCLLVTLSFACIHSAVAAERLKRGWWLGGGIACGLGLLAKGPVALALVLPPVIVWQFLDRRTARLSPSAWLGFLGAALLVAGPWYVATGWRDPTALGDFFWLHNLVRFVTPIDHEEPVWFYVPGLVAGTLPWSLLLIPLVPYLGKRSPSAGRRRPAALGLFLLALVWCVLFFSVAGCKRAGYIVPAYPLLALVLGTFLASVLSPQGATAWLQRAHPAWARWAHRATLSALGLSMVVIGAAALRGWWTWQAALAASLVLAAVLAVLWRSGPSRFAWRGWGLCGLTVFALLLGGVRQVLPWYHHDFGMREQVRGQEELDMPVASYPKRWDSISFYLQRDDVEAYTPAERDQLIRDLEKQGQTLLFVRQGEALQELLNALPPEMKFVPHGRPGRTVVSGIVQAGAPR